MSQGRLLRAQLSQMFIVNSLSLLHSNNEGSDITVVGLSIKSGHLYKQIKYVTHLIIGMQLTLLYSSLWYNLSRSMHYV